MKLKLFLCLCFLQLIIDVSCKKDPALDKNNYFRPCPDYNLDCIRNYFWVNSECKIANGPVPDPLLLKHFKVDIANSNITADLYEMKVENLNGVVIEFYENTETGKVVLALEPHGLRLYTSNALVKFFHKAREPVERTGSVDYKYDTITFTAIFEKKCGLDLRTADISTYIDDTGPEFSIGDSISSDLDCTSDQEFQQYLSNASVSLQEIFVRQGRVFMGSYIQYNICNYGIEDLDNDV